MKKLCLFLVWVIITAALSSCGNNSGKNEAPTDGSEAVREENAGETTTGRIQANVPVNDYGGYAFRMLGGSEQYNSHWYSRDLDSEEIIGEPINDAVYERNRKIEEMYNISVNGILAADPIGDAQRAIRAGTDEYDIISVSFQIGVTPLIHNGYLHDLKSLNYLDLEKPWWDQQANKNLSIENKLYGTISDLLVMDKDALFIFLFNKDLIQDFGLEIPYDLVRQGKWTVDKMYEMARKVSSDIDGDGTLTESDRYGIGSQTHTMHGMVTAGGENIVNKDGGDIPYFNMESPKISEAFTKWMDLQVDTANTIIAQDYASKYPGDLVWDMQLDMLNEKLLLFLYTGMNRVTMLRSMECNFGILPVPKITENQDTYYNAVHMWCSSSITIPITVQDTERTSIILEALTAESYYTLLPAYYDISLKSKLTRDEESSEMLDLIFATRSYDLGSMFNWANLHYIFGDLAAKKSFDLTSAYEKVKDKAQKELDKTLSDIMKTE